MTGDNKHVRNVVRHAVAVAFPPFFHLLQPVSFSNRKIAFVCMCVFFMFPFSFLHMFLRPAVRYILPVLPFSIFSCSASPSSRFFVLHVLMSTFFPPSSPRIPWFSFCVSKLIHLPSLFCSWQPSPCFPCSTCASLLCPVSFLNGLPFFPPHV